MLIIYQGKTEISAQTDTERECTYLHVPAHAQSHTHKGRPFYANCPSGGKKKWKHIKKTNQSSNHFANTVRFNFALFALCSCVFVCVCVCGGMAAYRQAVIHLGI